MRICCLRLTRLKLHDSKYPKQNGLLLNVETGSHELVILSYATVCLHPSVSLNNEQICREISKDKIAVCEKTAGLRSGNSSDLNSACLKALVPVEIFQFSDMHYESRFLDTFRRHNIRPICRNKTKVVVIASLKSKYKADVRTKFCPF